ncbi:uncharacterized protein BHQ10_002338 [Talaromyces amestolkiae]|uniref:Trichodiene synthase n=1 Tax=Talaromyces amestolkiae TaxID=1196081 RepID=A0A364KS00_TALAM|nr:uncharacterized protein BHQ10_002338 [Talaromyces amestolkiae]RAO66326.1 hypothetical protein BHQ10_002338 [Talaromyces amestolkiae]
MVKPMALISTLLLTAHDAISKSKLSPTNRVSLKEKCAIAVNKLLHGTSYQYPAKVCFDQTLKKKVENSMLKAGLSSETLARIQPYIDSSVNISLTCYAHTSPEVREFVAIYTSYAITVDDLGHEFPDDMKGIVSSLLNGHTIENTILRGYFDLMRDHGSQFGQFGSDMIAKATVDFVCSCYVELELEQRKGNANVNGDHHHTVTAPEFAEYFRIKTGVSEPYAFFAFPEHLAREDEWLHTYLPAITYMVKFFNYANDVLSFYKESGAEEKANYISNQAAAHNISRFESLEMLCKRTIEVFHTIDAILAPNEDLRRKVHQWMHGYLAYHMVSARYRLDELGIPAVVEARQLFFGKD